MPTHGPPAAVRQRSGRREPAGTRRRSPAGGARVLASCAPPRQRRGANSVQHVVPGPADRHRRRSSARGALAGARSARWHALPESARTFAPTRASGWRTKGSARAERAPGRRRPCPARAARAGAASDVHAARQPARAAASRRLHALPTRRRSSRPSRASRARAAPRCARSSGRATASRRLHLRTGLVRQLAGARARRRQAISCPISRSSTRASSSATPARIADMFTLLRDLRRLRLRDRPPGAAARRRSPSATSTPDRATAANTSSRSPTSPLLRPPALRPEHRRLSPPRRRAARHGRRHDPHGERAAHGLRGDARAASRGGARDCALGCGLLGVPEEMVGRCRGRASGRPPHPRLPAPPRA